MRAPRAFIAMVHRHSPSRFEQRRCQSRQRGCLQPLQQGLRHVEVPEELKELLDAMVASLQRHHATDRACKTAHHFERDASRHAYRCGALDDDGLRCDSAIRRRANRAKHACSRVWETQPLQSCVGGLEPVQQLAAADAPDDCRWQRSPGLRSGPDDGKRASRQRRAQAVAQAGLPSSATSQPQLRRELSLGQSGQTRSTSEASDGLLSRKCHEWQCQPMLGVSRLRQGRGASACRRTGGGSCAVFPASDCGSGQRRCASAESARSGDTPRGTKGDDHQGACSN